MTRSDVLFWLGVAIVWLGVFGRGISAWNQSFGHLHKHERARDFRVIFEHSAFTEQGQRLRRRALAFVSAGILICAIYYGWIARAWR